MRFEHSTSKIQSWNPTLYENHARFVADLAGDAIALLDILPGERLLDLGCGDGHLTEKFANRGVHVVGADFSPDLVKAAAARGLQVHLRNGEELDFDCEFDAVFSNAALHWMRRADAVVAGVRKALRPGGRFVGEFAGARNAFHIRQAIHAALELRGIPSESVDPWYLPDEAEYRQVLEEGGLAVDVIKLFLRPVTLDYPISEWIRVFGSPYLMVLPAEARGPFLQEVTERLRPILLGPDGRWTVDYTRLRFRAVKKT